MRSVSAMVILSVLALISLVATVATIRTLYLDGYRQTPTDPTRLH